MSPPDRAKGCGAKRASRTANAQSSGRSQDRASSSPKASWVRRAVASNRVAVSKGPGSTGQLRSLTKDGRRGANARRSPRGSARRATEDVRRRAVGFGSLSRRTQRVTSRRERDGVARPRTPLACSVRHHGGSCRGEKPRHRRTGTAARTARPASLRNRHGPTMPRGRLATAARRVRT